ncbi:hypothetical protein [Nocardia pseudobrasiliensis]|uniref:Tetratricopeptide repeat protein n=1 Tax=Nocardia pseudobrasiliensis TaxID=45979 RepID=A0A370HS33_9NOCA|nr:hypothetical protein [Nocardia pseudobrasiliensis]RDI61352.1 hypothetical protein DFR76_11477 [Nocardia pseudobrasiliensis]
MSHSEHHLYQLLGQADQLEYGDSKDALLEQVLRHAEAGGHTRIAFDTRMRLVQSYTLGMHPAKLFVPFARCLADYDRDPATYEPWVTHTLRWYFKYAVNALTDFPEVPADKALAALDQMERRYRVEGQSLHAVYAARHRVAAHIGDYAAADRWYEKWCTTPRDENSDCEGCDPSSKAVYLVERGRDADADALATPVLQGELTCHEQPQHILSTLLLAYLRTGQFERARSAHRRAYRVLRTRPQSLDDIGAHLEFCALSGNQARGLELLDRHLGWLDRAPNPLAAMRFAAAAALLLRTVVAAGHETTTVRRPAHGERPVADATVSALRAELTGEALAIAARFDRRNGTNHQTTLVRAVLDREPLVDRLPLSPGAQLRALPAAAYPAAREPETPGRTAAEIIERAEHALGRYDEETAAALLRRLDPTDDPALAARTTVLRARLATDPADAERGLRRAAAEFAALGDENQQQANLGRLGVLLCERGAIDAGLTLLRTAYDHLTRHGNDTEKLLGTTRLAAGLAVADHIDEALPLLAAAAYLAAASGDPVAIGDVAAERMSLPARDSDERAEAIAAARRALSAFREADLPLLCIAAAQRLSRLQWENGDPEAALAAADQALAALPPDAPDDYRFAAYGLRGTLLNQAGRAAEAIADLRTAIAAGLRHGIAEVPFRQWDLAAAYRATGQLLDATDLAEDAVDGLTAIDQTEAAQHCRYLLAGLHRDLREYEPALTLLEQIAEFARDSGDLDAEGRALTEAAAVLDLLDRDDLAAQRHREAGEVFRRAGNLARLTRCRTSEAMSWRWAGDFDAAAAALAEAEQALRELAATDTEPNLLAWHRAELSHTTSRVLFGSGRAEEAEPHAAAAAAGYRELGYAADAARAELVHGRILLELGRPDRAVAVLGRALAEVEADDPVHPVLTDALGAARDQCTGKSK